MDWEDPRHLDDPVDDAAMWKKQDNEINQLNHTVLLQELRNLPTLCDPKLHVDDPRSECWIISYTAFQPGMYSITQFIEHHYSEHHETLVAGKWNIEREVPQSKMMIAAISSAMLHPIDRLTGPPHRPLSLCIAYRLKHAYEDIKNFMRQVGISCQLETIKAAKETAKRHGTDYLGRNAQRCRVCFDTSNKLLRCGGCSATTYCGIFCQKADWKRGHKLTCAGTKKK